MVFKFQANNLDPNQTVPLGNIFWSRLFAIFDFYSKIAGDTASLVVKGLKRFCYPKWTQNNLKFYMAKIQKQNSNNC